MERSLDECWPRHVDSTPYERIGSLEVDDFVEKVERKLGIHFTAQEHHKLKELFKYKPKVGVKRQDILKLLSRIGPTMNSYMTSSEINDQLSLLLSGHTLGLMERTASFLLGRSRAVEAPQMTSKKEAVPTTQCQKSHLDMEIERLRNHVESLERLILIQSADPNVSDLLKLAYENSKRIATLENIRDEQAAIIEEYRKREVKVEQLLERVALQNEMIDNLKQSTSGPNNLMAKQSSHSSTESQSSVAGLNSRMRIQASSDAIYDWTVLLRRKSWNIWRAMAIIILIPYSTVAVISILQCLMGPGPCKLQHSWLQNLPFLDYCIYTIQAQFF